MKLLLLNLCICFSYAICFASEKDSLCIYYSTNQSFVDIIDSISCIQKNYKIKESFQKQDFYVFFTEKDNDIYMFISHCRLFDDEYGSKYIPFGCIIKNDSFFYLVKSDDVGAQINTLFHKTDNLISPELVSKQSTTNVEDDDKHIFFAYRQSKLFKLINGVFYSTNLKS